MLTYCRQRYSRIIEQRKKIFQKLAYLLIGSVRQHNGILLLIIFVSVKQKNAGIVNRIKAYVSENIAQTITLEILSEVAELSPNYISTLFYKETGINFKDYLISVRIDKAKELLKNTQLKIYEVANAVGYEDTRYFSDVFCRNVGCLPSQYRKR